jgi:hypothetical protein
MHVLAAAASYWGYIQYGGLHYRNRALCRAPATHDKDRNTHSTAFAVRILPKRTAKGARRIFTR